MTAAGRLWRRAPLWRLVLAATLAFGVLSAIYPAPSLHTPTWLHWRHPPGAAKPAPPQPLAVLETPLEPVLRGVLAVGGRSAPLPAGEWHEILALRAEQTAELSQVVLGRWQGGALTGLLIVTASTGPADGDLPANISTECDDGRNTIVKWSDAGRTCWLTRKTVTPLAAARADGSQAVDQAALARLTPLGLSIPSWMSTAIWLHAAGTEFMSYEIRVANARDPNDASAALASLQSWMNRFAPLLRRGFEGRLGPGAPGDLARDPGFAMAAGHQAGSRGG